jgi:hypothetical protein
MQQAAGDTFQFSHRRKDYLDDELTKMSLPVIGGCPQKIICRMLPVAPGRRLFHTMLLSQREAAYFAPATSNAVARK